MAETEVFREQFEEFAPVALQTAYDYADAEAAVRTVWVIVVSDGTQVTGVAYDVNGQILEPHRLDEQLPNLDCSPEAQELLDPIGDAAFSMLLALRDAGEEMPKRMVLRYDVAEEEMNATMTYDDIQPGVADSQRADNGTVIREWTDRLRQTGNDSAEA